MLAFFFSFFGYANAALPFAPTDAGSARQIIYVSAPKGVDAEVSLYKRKENLWMKIDGPWPAVVGRTGVIAASMKKEGDGHTPAGLYPLGFSFGAEPASEGSWPYKQMTSEDKWIDDPASPQYNQLVRGKTDAKSYEEMKVKSGAYDLGVVVEYNTKPIRPSKGSAIFLHIWNGPGNGTAGCVALPRENLATIVKWLDPGMDARILIGD
jgi:L,D-peptidoglycan transpeptidase YkuD (ErfK/YbiS/YcfS/YnhG family)